MTYKIKTKIIVALFTMVFAALFSYNITSAKEGYGTPADVIALASSQIGYMEKATLDNLDDFTANAGSNNYTKYARDLGVANNQPWCAYFVWWCFKNANVNPSGYPSIGYTNTTWYSDRGLWHDRGTYTPNPGDYIVLGGPTQHCGIVEYTVDNKVVTIEGNSSNKVVRRSYELTSTYVIGYGSVDYSGTQANNSTNTYADPSQTATPTLTPTPTIDMSTANSANNPGAPYPIPARTLQKTVQGEDVKWLQQFLNECYNAGLEVDGDFGEITEGQVKTFQLARGILNDGIVDTTLTNKIVKIWRKFKKAGNTGANTEEGNTGAEATDLTAKNSSLLTSSLRTLAFAKTPVGRHGNLRIRGTKIVDKNGKTFQLKGISSHGINWDVGQPFVSRKVLHELRDKWGVNCFRVAMYTEDYNGYCVTDASSRKTLLKTINTAVNAAKELGMYVIIDWHVLNDQTPVKYQKQAINFFNRVSKQYSGYPNVLYEICNEPNGATKWGQIKKYANKVIPVIRRNSANALVVVGTPTWSQDVDVAATSPLRFKNVAYAVHFYAATHGQAYRDKVKTAVDAGLPVLCTEFSACEASGNGNLNKSEAKQWLDMLDGMNIGYVAWSLSNKDESASLLSASCTKHKNFKSSDLSAMGKWLVRRYTA